MLARSSPEILRPVWCGTQVLAVADCVAEPEPVPDVPLPSMTMPLMALPVDSGATAG